MHIGSIDLLGFAGIAQLSTLSCTTITKKIMVNDINEALRPLVVGNPVHLGTEVISILTSSKNSMGTKVINIQNGGVALWERK